MKKALKRHRESAARFALHTSIMMCRNMKKPRMALMPLKFQVERTPDFLEGSVHMLKLKDFDGLKKTVYDNVKNSRLYDQPLKMYKVNASLSEASFELGQSLCIYPRLAGK